jgi:hypothetical protein
MSLDATGAARSRRESLCTLGQEVRPIASDDRSLVERAYPKRFNGVGRESSVTRQELGRLARPKFERTPASAVRQATETRNFAVTAASKPEWRFFERVGGDEWTSETAANA